MKLGNTPSGTGIVCENKFELSLIVSTIYDKLDLNFWAEVEDECVDMKVYGMPVYLKDKLNEKIEDTTLSYLIEELKYENSQHDAPRYIVYMWGVSPKEIVNLAISQAKIVAEKTPYKL